jgi:hypothetical protein
MKYVAGPVNEEIEIDISFPEGENKRILYAISGGADSAILLYLLAKQNKQLGTQHQIIPFTVPRPDNGASYSPKIVSWINNKLETDIPMPLVVGDGNLHHSIVVKKAIKDLMATNQYDHLFVAENKTPPIDLDGLAPVRAKSPNFKKATLPFWGITKEYTIDLYYRENIPELLEITHSCTELKETRCNKCFQCNERAWAFKRLDRTDPGNI